MENEAQFHAGEENVALLFPDETLHFSSIDLATLMQLAEDHGIRDFNVYKGNVALRKSDFPVTEGTLKVVPVNKAGVY